MLSLGKLKKMRHLTLGDPSITSFNINMHARDWDAAVAFQDLRCLFFPCTLFDRLPSWISSSHLPSLSHLEIRVGDVDEQGLKALGGLPELYYLNLRTCTTATITRNTAADGCFQKLKSFVSCYSSVHFVANEDSSASFTICAMHKSMVIGTSRKKDDCRVVVPAIVVMPNLEELEFGLSVKQLMQNKRR